MTGADRSRMLWELKQRLAGARRARKSAKSEEEKRGAERDVALLEEEIKGVKALEKVERQARKEAGRITGKLS